MKNKEPRQINSRKILLFGFFLGLVSCTSSPYEKSEHYDGKKFFNPGVQVNKGLLQVLKWQLQGRKEAWPDWIDDNLKPRLATQISNTEVSLTYVNHATHLIQVAGLNVLTDPMFSKRASPLSWLGPRRHRAPGIAFQELPRIHVVLISHNHYDHMDLPTIRDLANQHDPLFVTPLGNGKYLQRAGAKTIVELDWWQKTELPSGGILHLAQVQHWSSRSLFDTNEALWGGFVLQVNGLNIYFGGDSGYGPHYIETKNRYGPMDVSILPIGSYEPRWFMKEQHMNPEEGIQAHRDLQSRFSIGTHVGTFDLANDGVDRPIQEFKMGLAKAGIQESEFVIQRNGESVVYKK